MMPPRPRPLHVLIADQSRETTADLARLLYCLGHGATVAHSAEEALFQVRLATPDVVLLDLHLPGMHNDLLRQLFYRPGMEGTLRIAMTGEEPINLDAIPLVYWHLRLTRPIDPVLLEHLLLAKQRVLF